MFPSSTVDRLDQTKARDFYVDVLGFKAGTDITMGEGFRWVTVRRTRTSRSLRSPS